MRCRAISLAVVLMIAPLGAGAADLVVWWDKGFTAEESEAAAEVVHAFERDSGKQVELTFHPQLACPDATMAALKAGKPPDFVFCVDLAEYIAESAFQDRLVDLSDAIGPFSDLFDPNALDRVRLLNGRTGQKALYGLPIGRSTHHLHVWRSLLERAGFTLGDIPREWAAFWSFWCDDVQPAVRRVTGREDIWGIGLSMSPKSTESWFLFLQFLAAYGADYVTSDGRLVIDDPEIRRKLIKAMDNYTTIYRKGCTPPDSLDWTTKGNNDAFLAKRVVMTPNDTLSIPNALKRTRPDDYYENTATVEWPVGPSGEPFPIGGTVFSAVVFKDGGHIATAEEFVGFLVREGWLAHYLNFSNERLLPSMPALVDQPFWLDPGDPHRMAAAMQAASQPLAHNYTAALGNWRHDRVLTENVWGNAIRRIGTEGISPERAVDEAIARIKQMLAE